MDRARRIEQDSSSGHTDWSTPEMANMTPLGFYEPDLTAQPDNAKSMDEELIQTPRPSQEGEASTTASGRTAGSMRPYFDEAMSFSQQPKLPRPQPGHSIVNKASVHSTASSRTSAADENSRHLQGSTSNVIDNFIERWPLEFHFWDKLAKTVASICTEGIVEKLKLKCHINYRAKAQTSLKGSIERRQEKRGFKYRSRLEIEEDMFDLAGVRITLAFPKDVAEVKNFLEDQFVEVEQRFWGLDENGKAVEGHMTDRFPGYRATHFLVRWRKPKIMSRTKLTEAHIGKTVEIQVTSIIMNAWQEAQHDLVYKQLNGAPTEDEKYLLVMINGLAHAGEVALTQLQNSLKRRIEDGSRAFADGYEVRAWLKTHIPRMLKIDWQGYGPYMQRLTTLFDVIQIFGLKTPNKVQEALEVHLDTQQVTENIELGFVGQLMSAFQEKLCAESNAEEWQRTFRDDPTDWATLKLCTHRYALPLEVQMPKIQEDRLKAFFIINTINFALSEDVARAKWIQKLMQKVLTPHTEYEGALVDSLFILLTTRGDESEMKRHGVNMEMIWSGFMRTMRDVPTIFLRLGLALSYSGIVVLPAITLPDFNDEKAPRFVVWPGSQPYNAENLWGGCVSIVSSGKEVTVSDFEWRKLRVSLQDIAEGRGWCPSGPPMETLPVAKLEPTPLSIEIRTTRRFADFERPNTSKHESEELASRVFKNAKPLNYDSD
ncbi:MAG: hypothetical protein Q9227_008637 [Pyrenula ochraceoflavens]